MSWVVWPVFPACDPECAIRSRAFFGLTFFSISSFSLRAKIGLCSFFDAGLFDQGVPE